MATLVLIGAGRVAEQVGLRLMHQGHSIVQVYNRSLARGRQLAQRLSCTATDTGADLRDDADLYILAVSDAAVAEVAALLRPYLPEQALVVHTSGATPSSVLAPYYARYGVFYPLQTFTPGREIDWTQVPFCLYANVPEDGKFLTDLAAQIGGATYWLDDAQRSTLHVGAVFVNNFTNHLYRIAEQLLREADLPFELLLPLITETAQKVTATPPAVAQTGPARRGDQPTIDHHLALLQQHPAWAELYRKLTADIQRSQK